MTKPLKPLVAAKVDSSNVLKRVQKAVREIVTPSWITRPPPDVGLSRAGTLKADHWRVLFAIHLPLALISLWGTGSPIISSDAGTMKSVLKTSMHLTCASIVMTRNNLSANRLDLFQRSLAAHIEGLKDNFPGFMLPSHHLAFHIYDFMGSFANVREWWNFSFENLIGKLQRIPINHKIGEWIYLRGPLS